jgi:hypothetical protein
MLRRALGGEIEVETAIAGGLWNSLVDPDQLENGVLNLAINARDATNSEGRLTIDGSSGAFEPQLLFDRSAKQINVACVHFGTDGSPAPR